MSAGDYISYVRHVRWPPVWNDNVSRLMATVQHLEQVQRWPADVVVENQMLQMRGLVEHTAATCPYYQRTLAEAGYTTGDPIDAESWRQLPILTRDDLQSQYEQIKSTAPPVEHGEVTETKTSGSTGQPITVQSTTVTRHFWAAMTIFEHYWHQRDYRGKLCAIRPLTGPIQSEPKATQNWGPPLARVLRTGPGGLLDCRLDPQVLLDWLVKENPQYVLTLPSTMGAIAQCAIDRGIELPNLLNISSYAEQLKPEVRELCRQAFNVVVTDMYSAQEIGYIALQCSKHEHYHVTSPVVYVEVLDEQGGSCAPGEIGRVVVTSLHNFASPLIRYELLDYAEVGEACSCGRAGMPVIKRIVGRQRNLITLPDGTRYWPVLYASAWSAIAPIRQLQLIQKRPDHFHVNMVMDRDLTDAERDQLVAAMNDSLGYPFTFDFERRTEMIRGENGKFESITTEVTGRS